MKKIVRLYFYLIAFVLFLTVGSNVYAEVSNQTVPSDTALLPKTSINFDKIGNFKPNDEFGVPTLFKQYLFVMGHGAGDPGARGNGTNEASFTRNELLPLLQKYASQLKFSKINFYDPSHDMYQDSCDELGAYTIPNYESVTEFHLDASTNTNASGGHVIVHPTQVTNVNKTIAQIVNKYVGLNPSYAGNYGLSLRSDLLNLNVLNHRGIAYRLVELGFITNTLDVTHLRQNLDLIARDMVERITGERITPDVQANSIDYFAAMDDQMKIKGWFESSQATTTGYPYLYALDANEHELARFPLTLTHRADVASAYPNIANAGNSGFELTTNLPNSLRGKMIYFKAGKAASANGDNLLYQVHFTKGYQIDGNVRTGNIDSFKNQRNDVQVSGWFFDSTLSKQGLPYLSVFDENNQEVTRMPLALLPRADVGVAYRSWSTSLLSGFNTSFKLADSLRGKKVRLVARNLAQANSQTAIFDVAFNQWYTIQSIIDSASLDRFELNGEQLIVNGWHFYEKAPSTSYRWLVLSDVQSGKEFQRINYQATGRQDVAASLGNDAWYSGFNQTVPVTDELRGHSIKVTAMLTSDAQGSQILSQKNFNQTVSVPALEPTEPVAPVQPAEPDVASQSLYRVYNPNSGEHLYTAKQEEAKKLISLGWKDEKIAWYIPSIGNPVYRLYNPNSGEHFYTLQLAEYEAVAKSGWQKEGIAFYSDVSQSTPIYRVFNPNAKGAGSHHYTPSASERDQLIQLGWKDEKIAFYGAK